MLDREQEYPTSPVLSSEKEDIPERSAPVQVHTLPVDTPPERLRVLIVRYRELLDDYDEDQFTYAYCQSVIAEAGALLAGSEVAR